MYDTEDISIMFVSLIIRLIVDILINTFNWSKRKSTIVYKLKNYFFENKLPLIENLIATSLTCL